MISYIFVAIAMFFAVLLSMAKFTDINYKEAPDFFFMSLVSAFFGVMWPITAPIGILGGIGWFIINTLKKKGKL